MGRFSLAQIKSIHVQFNAADAASRAVREFLSRCTTAKALESNPKCDITHKLRIDAQPPVVALEYGACLRPRVGAPRRCSRGAALICARALPAAVSGVKDLINCKALSCQDIIQRVQQRTEEMDTKALLKAAGLDGLRLESRATQQ
jgi:hypothetical protein